MILKILKNHIIEDNIFNYMAKNTGNNTRKGAVKDRTQIYNEKTNTYLKRGPDGKFMSGKSTPYKGVTNEQKKSNK